MNLYSSINLLFINLFTHLVPRWFHAPFAFFWGGLFYLLLSEKRRAVRLNLQVVLGQQDVDRLVFSTFYKYARNWCDVMLMIRYKGEKLQGMIGHRSSGQPMYDALGAGTGAILISPHFGNWELGGLGLADQGYRINVMTFREPDEKVNRQREKVRQERGIGVVYVDRNDSSPLAVIEAVNALRRNEVVCMIGDRDGSSNSIRVDFFGRPTDIPAGAAYLSLATGAPVIPVFVPLMTDGLYGTLMEKAIYFKPSPGRNKEVIREGMQRLIEQFEVYIRQYPDQWYNFFDFWGVQDR